MHNLAVIALFGCALVAAAQNGGPLVPANNQTTQVAKPVMLPVQKPFKKKPMNVAARIWSLMQGRNNMRNTATVATTTSPGAGGEQEMEKEEGGQATTQSPFNRFNTFFRIFGNRGFNRNANRGFNRFRNPGFNRNANGIFSRNIIARFNRNNANRGFNRNNANRGLNMNNRGLNMNTANRGLNMNTANRKVNRNTNRGFSYYDFLNQPQQTYNAYDFGFGQLNGGGEGAGAAGGAEGAGGGEGAEGGAGGSGGFGGFGGFGSQWGAGGQSGSGFDDSEEEGGAPSTPATQQQRQGGQFNSFNRFGQGNRFNQQNQRTPNIVSLWGNNQRRGNMARRNMLNNWAAMQMSRMRNGNTTPLPTTTAGGEADDEAPAAGQSGQSTGQSGGTAQAGYSGYCFCSPLSTCPSGSVNRGGLCQNFITSFLNLKFKRCCYRPSFSRRWQL